MFSISEQLSLAIKAFFDAHLVSTTALAQAAFDNGVTVVDLNVDAVKTSLAAATVATHQLMSVKSTQEWMSLTANQSQLALERAHAYGRQAADIAQGSRANFSRVAETEGAASKQKLVELVDAVKTAPATAATPINKFFKTAFDSAQAGYDQFTRAIQPAALEVANASAK